MANFQQAVEKLQLVFQGLQGALRGPARSPWSYSAIGGNTQGTFQSGLWRNPAFGAQINKQIVSDAVRQAVATGGDPMQLLGRSADRSAAQLFLTNMGTKNDYFGGLSLESGKFIRNGMQTGAERSAYEAAILKSKMSAGIGEAELGSNVAFRIRAAARKSGNMPVSVSREAVESMQAAHGRLSNYLTGPGSSLLNRDQVRDAEASLHRVASILRDVAASQKMFGKEARVTQEAFQKVEGIARQGFLTGHTAMQGAATPAASPWWRAGRGAVMMLKSAGKGVGDYFRRAGADYQAGNLDWRAFHAAAGFTLGSLSAAGGPAYSTLAGSAQLALGSLGQGMIPQSIWASRQLQGLAHWMQQHPTVTGIAGGTLAAGVGLGALGAFGSRVGSGARLAAGVAHTGARTAVGLGSRLLGVAPEFGAVSSALAGPAAIAGTAYLPIKAASNILGDEGTLKERYQRSQYATNGDRLNPLQSMAKFLFGRSKLEAAAKSQEDMDDARRQLAISFGGLAGPAGAVAGGGDLRGYLYSRSAADPLQLEELLLSYKSMMIFMEKIAGNTEAANEILERMTVGNRP
jgi:hypothetical protein